MIRIVSILVLILFMNCSEKETTKTIELAADNPFNVGLNEPIDYANVTGASIEDFVSYEIEKTAQTIEIIKNQSTPTLENTFLSFDAVLNRLSQAGNNSFMLYWTSTDSITRVKGIEYSQKIDSLRTEISSDKGLFRQFKTFAASDDYKKLNNKRKRFVDDIINNFELSGVNLDEDKLKEFKTLQAEISELTSQYSTNMNTANAILKLNEPEAEGLPESFKEQYKTENGTYEIPAQPSTSGPVMQNAIKSETRKAFQILYSNRGADKNLEILNQLVEKRYQLGQLMGYKSYAEYNLVPKMAKNPETVWKFVNDLVAESKEKAIQDIEALKTARERIDGIGTNKKLNSWDLPFYHNQILKTQYKVDNEKIRAYLPTTTCLTGMFELYQELLDVEFRKIENASVWHEDVEAYEVYENGKLKGRFYLDLFPRPNKESWFYAVPLSNGKQMNDGYEVPVAMLLGNFTMGTDKLPSMITHNELSTLFHEFGHIMDSMSYSGEYSLQADTKSDFVEAMSQIFENWIWDYDILSSFAKHYETGEVLPKELFDNMVKAKNVSSGISAQRSLRSCIYDMNLYDKYNPEKPLDTDQLWRDIDKQLGVMDWYVEGTHPQGSWIHINTHPVYYYGYLWSEVYAQDMFTVFKKNGLRDQKTGVNYRKMILANGSQRPVDDAVEEFIGRPMNNQAYIKSLGLE
ncbi:Zn-dependent oligopeptidase [Winogradskyella echinorum]|uniref:Zn-dependent oligopeptidase n=1 Tax=Winogradskyella echinorum TaxID=538189 RepID=A0ABR6Y1Y4_9FLAO|nr:M3 family metallopeptidase [Winogradskyella echinorum]MBC3846757.1 Zn-dependent oligopeptidase [Winogradskyella echinorum]MBC5751105.1 Zn-dependent oligopeptidase [Winogradskyella echinorum]